MANQSNSKWYERKTETAAAPAAKPAPTVPATKPLTPHEPTQDEIQTRAFEIYVSEGYKEGKDLENWLRAEKDLRSQRAGCAQHYGR